MEYNLDEILRKYEHKKIPHEKMYNFDGVMTGDVIIVSDEEEGAYTTSRFITYIEDLPFPVICMGDNYEESGTCTAWKYGAAVDGELKFSINWNKVPTGTIVYVANTTDELLHALPSDFFGYFPEISEEKPFVVYTKNADNSLKCESFSLCEIAVKKNIKEEWKIYEN